MPVSEFLIHPEHEIMLILYRDIFVDEALLKNKFSSEAKEAAAIVKLDEMDIKKIGLKEGGSARISGASKTIVARVIKDQKPHEGYAFMPLSPWSNSLMHFDGKNFAAMRVAKVKISHTTQPVTELKELI
jgi:formylmethanofuran dehydrogenase subunit D